jgi:hypothetical protein
LRWDASIWQSEKEPLWRSVFEPCALPTRDAAFVAGALFAEEPSPETGENPTAFKCVSHRFPPTFFGSILFSMPCSPKTIRIVFYEKLHSFHDCRAHRFLHCFGLIVELPVLPCFSDILVCLGNFAERDVKIKMKK